MFVNTFWSLVPPIVAIGLALLTKETYSSLFIGIVVAVVLLTQSVAIPLRFRGQRRPKPMIAGVTEAMCLLLVFIAAIIICPHLA